MSLCEKNIECKDCDSRGMCSSYANHMYKTGKTDGYHAAEVDYYKKTEKDRTDSYNAGHIIGFNEAIDVVVKAIELAKLNANDESVDWYFGMDNAAEIATKLKIERGCMRQEAELNSLEDGKMNNCQCGEQPRLIEYFIKGVANHKNYFVKCDACRIRTRSRKKKQAAINEWNECIRETQTNPYSIIFRKNKNS